MAKFLRFKVLKIVLFFVFLCVSNESILPQKISNQISFPRRKTTSQKYRHSTIAQFTLKF